MENPDSCKNSPLPRVVSEREIFDHDFMRFFLSHLRSRLHVIGTSLYLIQTTFKQLDSDSQRYFLKIHEEIENLKKMIDW